MQQPGPLINNIQLGSIRGQPPTYIIPFLCMRIFVHCHTQIIKRKMYISISTWVPLRLCCFHARLLRNISSYTIAVRTHALREYGNTAPQRN